MITNIPVSRDFIIQAIEHGIERSPLLEAHNAIKLRAVAREIDQVLFGTWQKGDCECPVMKAGIDRNVSGVRRFANEYDRFCLRHSGYRGQWSDGAARLVVTT